MTAATQTTNGAPLTGAPPCPKCGGRMWDNRASKRNPRAPDFKCRDRNCDGVLWPGQHKAAAPIVAPTARPESRSTRNAGRDASSGGSIAERRAALRRSYVEATDFVLAKVRPMYRDAGLPCTDATVAAIVATLFIATTRSEGV